jgi:phage baseplate assembly protein W
MIALTPIYATTPLDLDGYAVSVEDSFYHALTTPKGWVVGRMNYGTGFRELRHRALNSSTMIDIKRYCRDACAFDARLNFISANIDMTNMSAGFIYVTVELSIGKIEMKVTG